MSEMIETFISEDDAQMLNRLKADGITTREQLESLFTDGTFLILPTIISSRKNLNSNDKLLIGELMALSRSRGACSATNEHLATMLGVNPRTIKRSLQKLFKLHLIKIYVQKNDSGTYRTLHLSLLDILSGLDKLSTRADKLSRNRTTCPNPPYPLIGIEEIRRNIEDTPISPKGEGEISRSALSNNPNNSAFKSEELFAVVWAIYPRPVGKKIAYKHFHATVKTMGDFENIKLALAAYKDELYKLGTIEQYIKMGSTWFNCWQDYIPQKKEPIKIESRQDKLKRRNCPTCKAKIELCEDEWICVQSHKWTDEINKLEIFSTHLDNIGNLY